MKEEKDKLNDTKYLLEETDYKNINNIDDQSIKKILLNNTQLLLEDKSSIFNNISNDNLELNQEKNLINDNNNNNNIKESVTKHEQENSLKDIFVKNINNNYNEEKEKLKDEQEIIKQQNILLNNQSTHLDDLFNLSYNDIINNKNKIIDYNNNIYNNQIIYFGVLFPTEKIVKKIYYKNDDKKKIICFKIKKANNTHNDEQYFKILIDQNKNYFNLKSNEEINLKVLLEVPFIKIKKQLKCDIEVFDINNCLIDTLHLYANIEIPKLCCMRYNNLNFNLKEFNIPLIQIKINLDSNNDINNFISQKFKIPMKNLSIKDLLINFFILSNPKEENNFYEFINYEIFFENEKEVLFPSLDINYFDILINIKIKNDFYKNIKEKKNIRIKKILGANIVDTKINYYFCLEILIFYINNDNVNNIII